MSAAPDAAFAEHGVSADGINDYRELPPDQQERIPGIDPATGLPDSRFDGTITCHAPLTRTPEVRPTPNPHAPGLVEAVRSSDLMIARDLGVGLAQLAQDDHLRAQAAEIRRGLDERFRR